MYHLYKNSHPFKLQLTEAFIGVRYFINTTLSGFRYVLTETIMKVEWNSFVHKFPNFSFYYKNSDSNCIRKCLLATLTLCFISGKTVHPSHTPLKCTCVVKRDVAFCTYYPRPAFSSPILFSSAVDPAV